jgi:hypothetical protein
MSKSAQKLVKDEYYFVVLVDSTIVAQYGTFLTSRIAMVRANNLLRNWTAISFPDSMIEVQVFSRSDESHEWNHLTTIARVPGAASR